MEPDKTESTGTNGGNQPDSQDNLIRITPEKRGRGRPKGSKSQASPKAANSGDSGKTAQSFDPRLVAQLLVSICEIGDDMAVLVICAKAKPRLTKENFAEFRQSLQDIRLGNKDKQLIFQSGEVLARKYPFLGEWGPELMLLACFVQYSARMGNALRQISALPILAKQAEQNAQA